MTFFLTSLGLTLAFTAGVLLRPDNIRPRPALICYLVLFLGAALVWVSLHLSEGTP